MTLRARNLPFVVSTLVAVGTLVVQAPARGQSSDTAPPRFEPSAQAPARAQPSEPAPARVQPSEPAPARAQPSEPAPARVQSSESAPARVQSGQGTPAHPQSGAVAPTPVPAGEEAIDDPKLARRLGTRLFWASPITPEAPRRVVASDVAPMPRGSTGSSPADPSASGSPSVVSQVASPPAVSASPSPPRLKLAFRRFDFVRIGAAGATDGSAASEPFDSVSIDVYPLSSFVRIGLSTQYGWQAGAGLSGGDYFANESLSLGVQLLGRPVVPFAEGFAGIGYLRRLQFDRTVPTAYWQLGVDVGAEIYFARTGFVSLALGYLRPVNGFVMMQQFTSAFVDTWSFKLGIGL